jgi:hypothetical protein
MILARDKPTSFSLAGDHTTVGRFLEDRQAVSYSFSACCCATRPKRLLETLGTQGACSRLAGGLPASLPDCHPVTMRSSASELVGFSDFLPLFSGSEHIFVHDRLTG